MKVEGLLQQWEHASAAAEPTRPVQVHLSVADLAKIAALGEMYPGVPQEQIITQLIAAALDEIESAMPYVPGDKVIAEDEYGDPIYEDVGPTPRFQALAAEHRKRLRIPDAG